MTTEIESLLERVRRATGPDRELDSDLGFALGWYAKGYDFYAWVEADGSFVESVNPKPFTSSMDACLALIERMLSGKDGGPLLYARKSEWASGCIPQYLATLYIAFGKPANLKTFWAQAETEPLALLEALLLALLHQASDKGMIDG